MRLDRDTKGLAYAQAGLPQYLVFNIPDRVIEDYRDPSPNGYRTQRNYAPGQSLTLVAFPEITINAADLLPSK